MKRELPKRVYLRHGAHYFVDVAGRWHRLAAAKDGLPAMYRALADLTDAEKVSDRMPAVITRWMDETRAEKGWAPATVRNRERMARELSRKLAEFTPASVTAADVKATLKAFADKPRTHNQYRDMLRQVLAYAAGEGLRDGHNPVSDIKGKSTPGRRRVVTDDEINAIKAAALQATRGGPALVQMIDLALLTGQRIGDVIMMRWQDVTAGGVLVKQGKTGELLLIEWSAALHKAINACVGDGERIGHLLKKSTGDPYRYAGIRSAWDRACARAGVEDLHIHDLRGRAGVDALGDSEDLRAAQKLLGHKGEAMTRHYVDGKYHKRAKAAK